MRMIFGAQDALCALLSTLILQAPHENTLKLFTCPYFTLKRALKPPKTIFFLTAWHPSPTPSGPLHQEGLHQRQHHLRARLREGPEELDGDAIAHMP